MKVKLFALLESGSDKDIDVPMMPIRDFESILKELGFEDMEMNGEETNGWQVDFWYDFVHPDFGTYVLSGSLHYGGFKFGKKDVEDDE